MPWIELYKKGPGGRKIIVHATSLRHLIALAILKGRITLSGKFYINLDGAEYPVDFSKKEERPVK